MNNESMVIGLSIGVILVLLVMWYPLQVKCDKLENRIIKLESKHNKRG
jgi:hypothetical protein